MHINNDTPTGEKLCCSLLAYTSREKAGRNTEYIIGVSKKRFMRDNQWKYTLLIYYMQLS